VIDPSVTTVIEIVDVVLRSYFMTPATEPKLTNTEEVHEVIRGLTLSKSPGPNGIPNRAMMNPTASDISACPNFQCGLPHPSLHYRAKKRSIAPYTQTGTG
jgi:hypothetical protein